MRKPCCNKQEMNRGAWSEQEDQKLIEYVQKHGEGKWRSVPCAAGLLRCGKSCRLRWMNYLRPDLKRGNFAEDEDDLIIKLHALLGNRWSLIAGRLPRRTGNEVKNYWNSHLRRKLLNMGLNPDNHRIHHHLVIQPQPIKSIPEQFDKLSSAVTSSPAEKTSFREQDDKFSCAIISSSADKISKEIPDLSLKLALSNFPGEKMKKYSDNTGNSSTTLPISNDWKLGL